MTPTTAAVYARISQDRTGQGLGVGRQETDCRAWAEQHGWSVDEVYVDDDISAYSGKRRPSYERLLTDLAAGTRDGLVVWHPDRLHRSPTELETFIDLVERTGIPVGSVTAGDIDLTSPTGRMTARIVGAVARHESDHKAERIRRKHLELAEDGKVPGGGRRPFGFEKDRTTLREAEAAHIREAAQQVLAGSGVRTIASAWNVRSVPSVTGTPWSATTVKRLLRSGRIAGWREHHGLLVADAEWPAIIDLVTHRRLRAILDDPSRARAVPTNARSYLLSGFVRCAACGAAMTARPVIRKGHRYRRYACVIDRGGCNRVGIGAEPLEDLIVEAVFQRLDSPALAVTLAGLDDDGPGDELAGEIAELEHRSKELGEMFAAGEITRLEWAAARRPLQANLAAAQRKQAKAGRRIAVGPRLADTGVLRPTWPDLPLDQQRAIFDHLIETVTIAATTKANNRFDGERVDVRWRL